MPSIRRPKPSAGIELGPCQPQYGPGSRQRPGRVGHAGRGRLPPGLSVAPVVEPPTLPVLPVDLGAVQAAFGIPRTLEVVSYHPGASGTWRMRAGVESFAVKVLTAGDEWRRTQLVRQSELEQAAALAGVAMPDVVAPLVPGLGLCAQVGNHLLEAHRWVDTLPGGRQVDPAALHRWLGRTLALLHSLVPLGRESDDDVGQAYAVHPMADWAAWVRDAHRLDLPWAAVGAELLAVIPAATDLIVSALADPTLPRCLTHRDVNPPNVLHTEDGPVLCDFGYAGPDVAWLEAVSTAASFDAPDVLASYLDAGGRVGPTGTVALARAVGSAANWLAFNMWLSLGHRDVGVAQRREATARVPALCREVIDRVTHQEAARHQLLGGLDPSIVDR